ncbi:MAG TPA: hypothetical protein ENH80_00240 [Phycisphaerae bacterium]|nr:hypothetical protein [Phycisphaerae bacterium]HDZ42349.1 hypothetical protein [Phycisphaerae bacterium]
MNTLQAIMDRGVFPVTFHNYSPWGSPAGGPWAVKDWVDLGITVGRMPGYDPEKDKKEDVLAILDACAEAGIMCFVTDRTCSMGRMFELNGDEDAYRRGLERSLKDFGDHPALFGYDAGDEPAHDKVQMAYRTYAIQREMAPHLTPFMSCAGYSPAGAAWMGLRSYRRYIDRLVEGSDPLLLFHGSYAICANEPEAIDMHFLTYKMYNDAMLRHNHLPLWTTLLCTGHYTYSCPTADELGWQINISACLGQKGLAWFNVYTHRQEENYRWPPINEFGERTHTFEWLSYHLRRLQNTFGPTLLKLDWQQAYHIGAPRWGGFPNTIDSEYVKGVRVQECDKFPLLVSEFEDADGRPYVGVLNNSREGYGQVVISWHGQPKVYKIGWQGEETPHRKYFDHNNPKNATMETGPWMAPGQMELYRIEPDAAERL